MSYTFPESNYETVALIVQVNEFYGHSFVCCAELCLATRHKSQLHCLTCINVLHSANWARPKENRKAVGLAVAFSVDSRLEFGVTGLDPQNFIERK